MKKLVILGAGTAGTLTANKLGRTLDKDEWSITIVDREPTHYYQPGFLFIPFEIYDRNDVIKPKKKFIPGRAEVVFGEIDRIIPDENTVLLQDGTRLPYDYLVIATGTDIHPEEIEGMVDGQWQKSIFDFYTIDGATKLGKFLESWEGGRMVVNIAEMPIKCPVAPLEFVFLADDYFKKKGMRGKVDISLVTPLSGAFTKPVAASKLGDTLEKHNIGLVSDFAIGRVENESKTIVSWDEREVPFDLLVTIPTNMGNEAIKRSGMGDELNFVPTNKHTLLARDWENIFVIGDAADLPTSKAGSVAHFAGEILYDNFLAVIEGKEPQAKFDGHANCFIESGDRKGFLIDFNYDVEPLPGKFPLPVVGPFTLLEETFANHIGKVGFRWLYWHAILKGTKLPLQSLQADMSMSGKKIPEEAQFIHKKQ